MKSYDDQKAELMAPTLEALFAKLSSLKTEEGTLWFGISGSWRKTNKEVEREVREAVRKIMEKGYGIVSGGALNVDYFALGEALKFSPKADKIKIFLPVTLDLYAAHYRRRAMEGVITVEQAEDLISQLKTLKSANAHALIENLNNTVVNHITYFERNTTVVNASHALIVFQVNDSKGVSDALQKAILQGKPVYLRKFIIE